MLTKKHQKEQIQHDEQVLDTDAILLQIQTLHDKNQEILDLLSINQEQAKQAPTPYAINTKIVAKNRMEISKEALGQINNISKKKKKNKKLMEKVVNNAMTNVLHSIQFGPSLKDLIEQAEEEIQVVETKQL